MYMTECIAYLTPAAVSQYRTHCLKICYVRWDEWVPRSRLRWAVESNEVVQIRANDVVELWCCGANVSPVHDPDPSCCTRASHMSLHQPLS